MGLNTTHEKWQRLEPTKDLKSESLFGMSFREYQIWLSEEVMKPKFGKDILGKLAVRNLGGASGTDYTVVSDCGFREEALPLVRLFGATNVLLVHIMRDGCNFDNDSRSYIELDDLGVTTVDLYNQYDPEVYEMQVKAIVEKWTR